MLCKTITADNGLEFADISDLEDEILSIYFARTYSAWERGSNERHNGLLRRFIPKGKRIESISEHTLRQLFTGIITHHVRYNIIKHLKKSF